MESLLRFCFASEKKCDWRLKYKASLGEVSALGLGPLQAPCSGWSHTPHYFLKGGGGELLRC